MFQCTVNHNAVAAICKVENAVGCSPKANLGSDSIHATGGGGCRAGDADGLSCLLTVADVARALEMSARQVRNLWAAGWLPDPILVGGVPVWPSGVVQAWNRRQNMKGAR